MQLLQLLFPAHNISTSVLDADDGWLTTLCEHLVVLGTPQRGSNNLSKEMNLARGFLSKRMDVGLCRTKESLADDCKEILLLAELGVTGIRNCLGEIASQVT